MSRRIRIARAVLVALIATAVPTGPAHADDPSWIDIPERFRGLWSRDCSTTDDFMTLTGFGLTSLIPRDDEERMQTLRFTRVAEADSDELAVHIEQQPDPMRFEKEAAETMITPGDITVERCAVMPDSMDGIHRLWVGAILDLEKLVRSCRKGADACRDRVIGILNTRGHLRPADIAAGYRKTVLAGAILNARMIDEQHYERTPELRRMLRNRMVRSAEVGQSLVEALDVDDDGKLTADEVGRYPSVLLPSNVARVADLLPVMPRY